MKKAACKPTRHFSFGGEIDPTQVDLQAIKAGTVDPNGNDYDTINAEKTLRWAAEDAAKAQQYRQPFQPTMAATGLAQGLSAVAKPQWPAAPQSIGSTFQQDSDARQARINGLRSSLNGMERRGRANGLMGSSSSMTLPSIGFAEGGKIDAEELMRQMSAKYGAPAAGPTTQSPIQQAAQPKPQAPQGIIGLIKNRGLQIDKAVNGYRNGGKIKGPGTPTSDSIAAEVVETKEPIRVANEERIVSAAQDKVLEGIAKKMGYDSLDQMLEVETGKPVGPTIKGGMKAAEFGYDIVPYDASKDPSRGFTRPGIDSPQMARQTPLLSAPQAGTSVVPSNRPNWIPGGNPPPVDTSSFDDEVRNRAAANRANPVDYNKPMGNQAPTMPQQKSGIVQTIKAAKPYANAAMTGSAIIGNAATAYESDDPAVQTSEILKAGLTAFPATRPVGYALQLADPISKAVTGYGMAEGLDKLVSLHPDYMRNKVDAQGNSLSSIAADQKKAPNYKKQEVQAATQQLPQADYGNEGRSVPTKITSPDQRPVVEGIGPRAINLPQDLTTKDVLPGGYLDRGAGIIAARSKNGQLNVSNVGTADIADMSKKVVDGSESALIDQKNSTYDPIGQLARMQRMRLEGDAFDPSITDPQVKANGIRGMAMLDAARNGELQQRIGKAEIDNKQVDMQGKRQANAQAQGMADLQAKVMEGDPKAIEQWRVLNRMRDNSPEKFIPKVITKMDEKGQPYDEVVSISDRTGLPVNAKPMQTQVPKTLAEYAKAVREHPNNKGKTITDAQIEAGFNQYKAK